MYRVIFLALFAMFLPLSVLAVPADKPHSMAATDFPYPLSEYNDQDMNDTWAQLKNRVQTDPVNIVATCIFLIAIVHTFLAHRLTAVATKFYRRADEFMANAPENCQHSLRRRRNSTFWGHVFHFFGEIEIVFLLWVFPLMCCIGFFRGWETAVYYVNELNYAEPIFVVAIMGLAATRPILNFAESILAFFANYGGGSPAAWWFTILTVGPIMGSFITEPAAITICALLLIRHVYCHGVSTSFAYATLGLLFVNISVGGVLTNFAAPPVLMVARPWQWSSWFMFSHFGWKAVIGIFISTILYFYVFRAELKKLAYYKKEQTIASEEGRMLIPWWVTLIHICLLIWVVTHSHYPIIIVGTFLFFLGFHRASEEYQDPIHLRPPVFVGCFLGGLIIHGSLQGWWISVILENFKAGTLMVLAMALTAFNDNAAVTYLTSLIPNFSEGLKYVVVAGAVAGGGLTVIANAPNPAGQLILGKYFPGGVLPQRLFLAAIIPTVIVAFAFWLLPNV